MYRVIIVEDETTVRRGIVLTLDWNALGCAVLGEAANGEEGLSLALRLNPDIIVTDVKMPRMDGVEMIQKLRTSGCKSRFIILTAYGDFRYAQSALRLGVSDYLLKPLKDGDLETAVQNIIGHLADTAKAASVPPELSQLLNAEPHALSKYVQDALDYIHNHYSDDINISTVAGNLGISEGYLSRMFKKETDYTFTNYLIYYRIKLAMNLLKDYRLKVYEVAYEVGYSDTTYFSAQFKKIVGISPSEYQDKSR
ncbi:MAG: response regulator transcription factor [Lachnospiraceae bacterium]